MMNAITFLPNGMVLGVALVVVVAIHTPMAVGR
jgi:hypothetical protein